MLQAVGLQMFGLVFEVVDGLPVTQMQVLVIGTKAAQRGPSIGL